MLRRFVFALLACLPTFAAAGELIDPAKGVADPASPLVWYDINLLDVEGRPYKDLKAPFDRLPAKAENAVRKEVWGLSRNSAGIAVRFITDAPAVHAKWTLTSPSLAMPHMPATGVSGLDLYVKTKQGKWHWVGVGRPTTQTNTAQLAAGLEPGPHEYLLYLPLYNGVSAVSIGIAKDRKLQRGTPYDADRAKPIVFYGTSITQGGCASRPGMVHTAILGRRLGYPVVNLGFSGNGRMETEVGKLMAEIDASVYVIDCLPNMGAAEVAERTEPLVKLLRAAKPSTPILLVEDRTYSNAPLVASQQKRHDGSRKALWTAYRKMLDEGVGGLHYLPGDRLLSEDGEGTVDSSHPTDLGFVQHADAFEPMLRPLLVRQMPDSERRPVEGYTNQLSYKPGEEVSFHLASRGPKARMEIFRVGAERQFIWKSDEFDAAFPPVPVNASSHGCHWPSTLKVKVGQNWKSGYYIARIETKLADGKTAAGEVWFSVRSANPGKDTKILLQLSTNTYNAYTNWGGYSLYAYNGRDKVQGRRVSYDRPISSQFGQWELPFVVWAEKAGYEIDYAANSDLEQHPEMLSNYKLILSVGHDEYWSSGMRDALEKFIAGGGNVAFFSGNTCCWQVRPEEKGRALTCWKQEYRFDPWLDKGERKLLSTIWSHHLVGRPENTLTGVGFLFGGYHKSHGQFMDGAAAFNVHRPEHWLFEGTKLKRGDAFGSKDTIVGYECDGCELTMKDGLPVPTYRDGTPANFEVLATCPAKWHPDDAEWYEKWEKGRVGNSVLGVYTRGGTVMTAGTTDWSHGLRGNDPAVVRITKNVLDKLSK